MKSLCIVYLLILLSGIPNRSAFDYVYIVACPMPIMLEISLTMLALCYISRTFQTLLCKNYAGIINSSLITWLVCVEGFDMSQKGNG